MKIIMQNEITLFDGQFDVDAIFRQKIYEEMDAGQDEALYLCNLSDVARKYDVWCQKMPRVKPFYAVKCNSDENVVRLLAKLGTGFDCASRTEINAVLKYGVTPDRIIFANPCKANSHIRYAAATNTSLMTFDSASELEKIRLLYPDAHLVLRFRCDAKKAEVLMGSKFGCDPHIDGPQLLLKAKNLGLIVVGISFHVGSGCEDPPIYRKAIKHARKLFDYATTLGFCMTLLDIGGGFPGDIGSDLGPFADIVNAALDDYFPEGEDNIEIISEPGKYFVASAFTLGVTIHSKNEVLGPDGNVTHMKYYANDGVYGSFIGVLVNLPITEPHALLKNTSEDIEKCQPSVKSTLWGPTCDGFDKIFEDQVLPQLDIGDVLVFPNMGAYTMSLSTTFNGFQSAQVMYFLEVQDAKDLGINLCSP
uniref:ornithine decarboxylase n=1 Tax=Phlebotomus papatasi TaxID=29031 RepID=A0A1B0DKV6_PHLPP